MPGTLVHQLRSASSTDAGAVYSIALSCTAPGTLPDTAIFLMQVVTPSDPKDDNLQRLCSPADFVTYGTSRDHAAMTSGFYRARACTLRFPDVGTANTTWLEISSRINTLVNDYDIFLTAFLTQPEGVDTLYPTVDLGEKNARIATYKARVADVAAAEAERDDHQRTCHDPKSLELATLQTQLEQAQSDLAALLPVRSVTDTLSASYPSAVATITTTLAAAVSITNGTSATTPEKTAVTAQVQAAQVANEALLGYDTRLIGEVQTPLAAFVGALEARVSDLTRALNSAQAALSSCDVEMSRLQGAVDEARRARDAALADVRAVCTDYQPLLQDNSTLSAALGLLLGGV